MKMLIMMIREEEDRSRITAIKKKRSDLYLISLILKLSKLIWNNLV